MSRAGATRRRILAFALGLPGAYEDHPWDEDVAKVNRKIFVFLGEAGSPDPGMTVKLRDSHEQALSAPGAAPTGYGLGRAGWVTVPFRDTTPPLDVLKDWVEESYRLIAPKRLVVELDARPVRRRSLIGIGLRKRDRRLSSNARRRRTLHKLRRTGRCC